MSKKQILGSTLAYAIFNFIGVLATHSVPIFLLNQFERKFGPEGSLWLGIIIAAFAIPVSALGYGLPIAIIRPVFRTASNWQPIALAAIGAFFAVGVEALGGMSWFAQALPFRSQTNFYIVNLLTGLSAGGMAIVVRKTLDMRAA